MFAVRQDAGEPRLWIDPCESARGNDAEQGAQASEEEAMTTPIPTERLRELIAYHERFELLSGDKDRRHHREHVAVFTELLAARDALAALTKEAKNVLAIFDAGERWMHHHDLAIERLRVALAATEGGQGGAK